MPEIKIYATTDNEATFLCPHCGFNKTFDPQKFIIKKNVNIKCKCGISTNVIIEFRQFIRKLVSIMGSCIVNKIQKKCVITIKDISQTGMGIEFTNYNLKIVEQLNIGDKVLIDFVLDDKKASHIIKNCIVKSKRGLFVGLLFDDNNYLSEIGFYMMP